MRLSDEPQRYYLTLTVGVRIVLQGWWASEATARWKFSGWVGEYGNLHGAKITLVDEETGQMPASWP